jgi:hypothetical protein
LTVFRACFSLLFVPSEPQIDEVPLRDVDEEEEQQSELERILYGSSRRDPAELDPESTPLPETNHSTSTRVSRTRKRPDSILSKLQAVTEQHEQQQKQKKTMMSTQTTDTDSTDNSNVSGLFLFACSSFVSSFSFLCVLSSSSSSLSHSIHVFWKKRCHGKAQEVSPGVVALATSPLSSCSCFFVHSFCLSLF